MRLPDRLRVLIAGAVICAAASTALAAPADPPSWRYEAPIAVQRLAPFVELELPAQAYGRSRQSIDSFGPRDLRIVDSAGERVPFAWLPPRAGEAQTVESKREAALYPLPARPAADGSWRSPIDIVVEGERINVRRLASRATAASTIGPAPSSGGWMFDLGARKPDEPAPEQLRLGWSGPSEFSATFDIVSSDDLRSWRSGGAGQVLALQSNNGALTQPNVMLPPGTGRFVRLVWVDSGAAPTLSGAQVITTRTNTVAQDPPSELTLASLPAANSKETGAAARAVQFDLGGALPIVGIDLRWNGGTHVAPVRVQGRNTNDEAWRDLGAAVFYRLDRQNTVSESPTYALRATTRQLRLIPDERAAALEPASLQLHVRVQLARLVFAAQGKPPYRVQLGSADAAAAALPIGTLVPALADERSRFGQASLGDWSEVSAAARLEESRERNAKLRPWLLWAVLIVGVIALAAMVWRLTRSAKS